MKTLIATTIIALASSVASAGDLSAVDNQEFYSGQPDSSLSTRALGTDAGQFLEGNYAGIIEDDADSDVQGDRIGEVRDNLNLYVEGNWEV